MRKKFLLGILFFTIIISVIIEIWDKMQNAKEKASADIKLKEKEINYYKQRIDLIISNYCGENKKETEITLIKLKNERNIIWKKGFAIRNDTVLLFDPKEMYLGFYLSDREVKKINSEILPYSIIFCGGNIIEAYNSPKRDRYNYIIETERVFCYKISGYTLYLKDPFEEKGKWEPVKIRFIKELKPDPDREHAQYPCMLVYLETKWFKGEYELECE